MRRVVIMGSKANVKHKLTMQLRLVATAALVGLVGSSALALGPQSDSAAPSAAKSSGGIQYAQATGAPSLTVESAQAAAGASFKLPIKMSPQAIAAKQYVMLSRVPDWMTVRGAENVGAGVWLISAERIAVVEGLLTAAASGKETISVALLSPDGKVASESSMTITVGTATAAPAAPAGKSWTSLIPGAAPAPAAPAAKALPKAAAPAANEAKLVEYAKHLVRECTTCHSLYGQDVGIPLMIGLSKDRFLDTMNLYKTGKRDHPPMKSIAESLDDEQTLALALYLGRIKAPPQITMGSAAPVDATGTAAAAKAAVKRATPESSERVVRWIQKGEQLIATGEIAQARLMLERASEYGDARAAYLLGTSYDPNVLPWRPGMGLEAEPKKARDWYVYAQQLGGGPEVAQRLTDLPQR
jgi:cytochrome c553